LDSDELVERIFREKAEIHPQRNPEKNIHLTILNAVDATKLFL
jgi:hypothetical protein